MIAHLYSAIRTFGDEVDYYYNNFYYYCGTRSFALNLGRLVDVYRCPLEILNDALMSHKSFENGNFRNSIPKWWMGW